MNVFVRVVDSFEIPKTCHGTCGMHFLRIRCSPNVYLWIIAVRLLNISLEY